MVAVASPGTTISLKPVEAYVARLGSALSGPRRKKADLLAEARDSLVDATEAFEARGLTRDEAEQRAVDEFGDLAEVAPAYRTELGYAQSRRTAALLSLVMLAQPIIWKEGLWQWNRDEVADPGSLHAFLNRFVELTGGTAIAGAVLALIACGAGLRFPAVRDRATRVTAIFTLLSCVLVGGIALAMGLSVSSTGSEVEDLVVVSAFVLIPLSFVSLSAGRCLRLA